MPVVKTLRLPLKVNRFLFTRRVFAERRIRDHVLVPEIGHIVLELLMKGWLSGCVLLFVVLAVKLCTLFCCPSVPACDVDGRTTTESPVHMSADRGSIALLSVHKKQTIQVSVLRSNSFFFSFFFQN